MNIDPHWGLWVTASINKHFKTSPLLTGIRLRFENDPKITKTEAKEWIELKIDGPTWNFGAGTITGRFELNCEISVIHSDRSKPIYRSRQLAGLVEALYEDYIDVYRFGPEDDPENDKSYFGCLERTKHRLSDNAIVTAHHGFVEPHGDLEQVTSEAHYILEI